MLGLAIVGTFDANMVNGRGFIALACVMLGGWQPIGVAASALLFGAADAFQFRLSRRVESIGEWIPLLPYILTLVAISVAWGKSQGPAEEGRGLPAD
jgi:simple sugar transport system permease protein